MDQEKLNSLPELDTTPDTDFDLDDLLGEDLLAILNRNTTEPEADPVMPEPIAEIPAPAPQGEVPVEEYRFTPPVRRQRKRTSKGTKIFYTVYVCLTLLAVAAIIAVTIPLHNWLVRYEASQPEVYRDQVYDTFFAEPDWSVIYKLAEVQDTAFENQDAYAKYMQAKVAAAKNPKLVCTETSAGLSGDRKYIIKLDEEKVATFTLENSQSEDEQVTNWKLGVVEVFFQRSQSITVQKLPEHTVYINGVQLDDSYTIRTVSTLAEEYLPVGIHGYRFQEQLVEGLLIRPDSVIVRDNRGVEIPTKYDEATNTYVLQLTDAPEMSDEEAQAALDAAKANALYSIGAIDAGTLRKHFNSGSQVYKDIVSTPLFAQKYARYDFDESVTSVTDFYRYSDDLYSARVTLKLVITRRDGTEKILEMDTTYFLGYSNSAKKYLVEQMTNVSVQEQVAEVRLTFQQDDRQLGSIFAATNAESITPPAVEVPEGKVFRGWAQQTVDEKGNITLTIRFVPDENGNATVPDDFVMEPMTLIAVFGQEGADAQ